MTAEFIPEQCAGERASILARIGPRPSKGLPVLITAALWTGLVVGLIELGLFVARAHLTQHGAYRRSPHFLWTIPVANLAIFGAAGLLAALVRRIPRAGERLASWLLCTLALMALLLSIPGLRSLSCLLLAGGLACWFEPAISARSRGFRRLIRVSLPPLGVVLLILWASRRGLVGGPAPFGAPNVLFIVMDTVRADATSLNGSARDTTPNLAALAAQGARFEQANATAPWTLPSHASMFTGRWPWQVPLGPEQALDARAPTLAGYLSRHGYATAGFVANTYNCSRENGLNRGFGHYEDFVLTPMEALRSSALGWLICRRVTLVVDRLSAVVGRDLSRSFDVMSARKDAASINIAALRWIETQDDRPFFVFLNYFDTHDPYLLPAAAASRFRGHCSTPAERQVLRDWIGDQPRDRSPSEIRLARNAYDDCLSYLDGQIGRLIDELDRLDRLENTVIIVTSDHGEHFGEHSRDGLPLVGHGQSVYQPEIHVPLLIVAPDRIPVRTVVPGVVSLRNLPATIVDLVGLRSDSPFPGRSLVPPLVAADAEHDRSAPCAALAEFSLEPDQAAAFRFGTTPPSAMRAVITDGKAFHHNGDGHEEFYDLQHDPRELFDLAKDRDDAPLLDPYRTMLEKFSPAH
jgi:arylsulfatase A-like enzyme